MLENYCSDVMQKHFNKEPVITKNDKDFDNFTKCWICDKVYYDGDDDNIEALRKDCNIKGQTKF